MQDDRLAIAITHNDGTVTRWGSDEPSAGDIPRGLKFGTSIPGGFKDCSDALSRRVDVTYTDLNLFEDVRVYGPGNESAWEGRQHQFPRQHANDFAIQVGAVGWSAHLEDDASFREIYVDRDVTHWAEADLARRQALTSSSFILGKFAVTIGNGGISWDVSTDALPINCIAELYYNAPGGLKVARLGYQGKRIGTFTSFEAPTAFTLATTALTLDDTVRSAALTPHVQLMLRLTNNPGVTPASPLQQSYSKIAVYGNHGLTSRAITGEPDGFYASDVIPDVITRAAPKLNFTTGTAGSIAPTTFAIPHLVFIDMVTAASAVQLINGYEGNVWAVWEGKTFYYRPSDPSTATIWEARLSDADGLALEGDQATDIYTGIVATYTDPTGVARSVGPPGSATDVQSSALETTDPANPAVAAGLDRIYPLSLSVPTTGAGATQLAAVKLAELNQPQRRGQIVFNRRARCIQSGSRGVPIGDGPAWRPRAGDYVVIADIQGDQPRQIIQTDYDHDPRRNTASVGSTPFQLDAIVERLSSLLVGRL